MMFPGINLVMTVIGFAVSTMFIVFVCTRLICARIHLRRAAFPEPNGSSSSDLSFLERGFHGLEPVVVSSFATRKFGDEFFSSKQDTQCTICLTEYQEKDVLRILPYCGHFFHMTCIDIWLKQHSTCPVCRISLRDSPGRKRSLQPISSAPLRFVYNPEATNTDTNHCLPMAQIYSPGRSDCRRKETDEEHQFISQPSGSGEPITILTEVQRSGKDNDFAS